MSDILEQYTAGTIKTALLCRCRLLCHDLDSAENFLATIWPLIEILRSFVILIGAPYIPVFSDINVTLCLRIRYFGRLPVECKQSM